LAAIGGSNKVDVGISVESSAEASFLGIGGGSFSLSAKFEYSGSSEQQAAKRLFEKKNGEIMITRSSCFTTRVKIHNEYRRPKFSHNFIFALEKLNRTIEEYELNPNSERNYGIVEGEIKKFINVFGTHFQEEVTFGAGMMLEQRFTTRSSSGKESRRRKDCAVVAAGGCIGGSGGVDLGGLFSGSFEAEACGNYKKNKCDKQNEHSCTELLFGFCSQNFQKHIDHDLNPSKLQIIN